MRKIIISAIFLFFTNIFAIEGDKVVGNYLIEYKGEKITVQFYNYKDNIYNARIINIEPLLYPSGDMKGQERIDIHNKDEKLRNRKLVGIDFVTNMVYNSKDDYYENGFVYSPENGKTYYAYMHIDESGNLVLKGSLDRAGFLGIKQTWKKLQDN